MHNLTRAEGYGLQFEDDWFVVRIACFVTVRPQLFSQNNIMCSRVKRQRSVEREVPLFRSHEATWLLSDYKGTHCVAVPMNFLWEKAHGKKLN